jgi:hypothetical protein
MADHPQSSYPRCPLGSGVVDAASHIMADLCSCINATPGHSAKLHNSPDRPRSSAAGSLSFWGALITFAGAVGVPVIDSASWLGS